MTQLKISAEQLFKRPPVIYSLAQGSNSRVLEKKGDSVNNIVPHALLLSPAQWRVICQIAQGKSNKEIARALFMSASSVEKHISAIFKALNVESRIGIVAKVVRQVGTEWIVPKIEYSPHYRLTSRRLEVLRLSAIGKDTASIAELLGMAQETVGVHRRDILRTLGVRNIMQAAVVAHQLNLVESD